MNQVAVFVVVIVAAALLESNPAIKNLARGHQKSEAFALQYRHVPQIQR